MNLRKKYNHLIKTNNASNDADVSKMFVNTSFNNFNYDHIIIGTGIGGLMYAYQTYINKPNDRILIIDKGQRLRDRKCPMIEGKVSTCIKCKQCSIMSGFAGAGAFSDAKFNITTEYGGWINEYLTDEVSIEYMEKLDKILLHLTNAQCLTKRLYLPNDELKYEALKYDLHLLQGKVRHFGTDGIYEIMQNFSSYLQLTRNIVIKYNSYVSPKDIDIKNKTVIIDNGKYSFNKLIMALGRSGADDFSEFCKLHDIPTYNNQIDIGVRVEVPRIVCEDISKKIYEPKIKYLTKKHRDIVRTFCFNSGGEVVTENTDNILTVNGHANALEENKTKNSNFAILSTHEFTEPFDEPIAYLQHVAKLANMLGGGRIISQLFGDLVDGRRSTEKRFKDATIIPTLKSHTPGDISLAMPSAAMDNIIEMIYQLDKFMPGVANHDTILYGIEAKYYSCRPKFINREKFEILPDIYAIGDGAGVTRSLSQAGAMGLYLSDKICLDSTLSNDSDMRSERKVGFVNNFDLEDIKKRENNLNNRLDTLINNKKED